MLRDCRPLRAHLARRGPSAVQIETGPAGHWEGIMSLLFEILIGAIVVAAVGNLLIGLLPRRDKVEPADMERR